MSTQKFEESISRLEKIVAQLQSGELPLDQSLELFEQGVQLSRQCQLQLEAAERRVEILLREKGELKTAPFESGRPSMAMSKEETSLDEEADLDDEDDDEGDDEDDGVPF